MDTATKLIICALLGAFSSVTIAYEFVDPYPNVKVIDGELHLQRPGGGTTLAYPNAGISKEIPVNTSKGNYLVPVEKTFPVEPSKVGKAATRFLKSLPVIGTGLAIYDMVCDLSEICKDENGDLTAVANPYLVVSQPPSCLSPNGYFYQSKSGAYTPWWKGPQSAKPAGFTTYNICYDQQNNITAFGTDVPDVPVKTTRPVIESDWTAAETKLNAQPQQTAEALYNSDAPIPVLASTQSAPVTQQIAQTSTQTKDALGNVTGTQTATTTVKVEDTSTTNNVTYNITETTTITNYDENNQITNTQTSTSDNQPPKGTDTDETTLSFDDVPNDELEQEEVDLEMPEYESWGEGTCPDDVDLGVFGLSVSYQPVCEVATDLRPFFLLLASITAVYILAGVKTSE